MKCAATVAASDAASVGLTGAAVGGAVAVAAIINLPRWHRDIGDAYAFGYMRAGRYPSLGRAC